MTGSGKFELLTRVGFAARGLIYVLIGYFALKSGRTEDGGGVLAWLASGSGLILLAVMAAGLLAYGFWRILEAWIDSAGRGADAKGIAARVGGAISGLVHIALAGAAALTSSAAAVAAATRPKRAPAPRLPFPAARRC